MKEFVLSLAAASAASALIEGFLTDGAMKKYVRYLISLILLLVLIAPFRGIVTDFSLFTFNGVPSYDSTAAMTQANSVVAMHIERALCEKFSIPDSELEARSDGGKIVIKTRSRSWLFESDIDIYVKRNFGFETEVIFYE